MSEGVLTHLFKPGERLFVHDIAEKLGVSLTPVPQAIQQLAAGGLIEIKPRSGTHVAQLNVRDVEETCDLRAALECLAAETAVQRVTRSQLAEFRLLLARLGRPIATEKERKRHHEDNMRLHRLLIECSGNRRLSEMYESLNAHLQIVRMHSQDTDWAERLASETAEHLEIVAALEARDVRRLKKAIRHHILRGRSSLIAGLKEHTANA